jgi:hypothetical protein
MRVGQIRAIACAALSTIVCIMPVATAADRSDDDTCRTVSGQVYELEVEATELRNPINGGRVVGPVTGALKGAETAILTGPAPAPPGSIGVTTENTFVTKPHDVSAGADMLVANGVAILSFNNDGTVNDDLTLTVNGAKSRGKFAGATGTIHMRGIGFDFGQGAGRGRFLFNYKGRICGANWHDDDDED